jgi:hypothetical protein
MKEYACPISIDCTKVTVSDVSSHVNILCVKWGKKYGADYVNKLYSGIKRNSTQDFKFYCFTDDPIGLNQDIVAVSLKENWHGWWGKANLFSSCIFLILFNSP